MEEAQPRVGGGSGCGDCPEEVADCWEEVAQGIATHLALTDLYRAKTRSQGAQASGDGRSTGPDGLSGPAAGDQLAVPAQDGGRGDEQSEASVDREQSVEGAEQGAVVQLVLGRGMRC